MCMTSVIHRLVILDLNGILSVRIGKSGHQNNIGRS